LSRLLCTFVGLAALGVTGCEPAATSDFVRITFGAGEFAPPVEADTLCSNGGCDGFEQLEATLNFDSGASFMSSDAYIEILQYRVLYDMGGDEEEQPPFYSNETSVICHLDEPVTFNVLAVGQSQRDYVRSHFGTEQVDGTATLEIEGYDHRNGFVTASANFAISFADFVDDGEALE